MAAFEHGETVARVAFLREDIDAQRRKVRVYAAEESIDGAGFDPEETTEVNGTTTVSPAVLFLDHDQPVHPLDRWRIRGHLYDTIGDPNLGRIVNHFTGRKFRLEVNVRKVQG